MEISVLVNATSHSTVMGGNHGSKGPSDRGFSKLLTGLHEASSPVAKEVQASKESVSEGDLEKLLSFLESEEPPEMDDILEILDSLFLFLGIDLHTPLALDTVATDQNDPVKVLGYDKFGHQGLANTLEIGMEEVLQAIKELLSLTSREMASTLDQGSLMLLKAAKLYELLGDTKFLSIKESQYHELLQQLTEKVELLLEGRQESFLHKGTEAWKKAYMQRVFSEAAVGTNGRNDGSIPIEHKQTSQIEMKAYLGNSLVGLQWSKPEQLTLFLNSSAKETTPTQLIRQFESILSRAQFTNVGGMQKLNLKLIPEHLGRLSIELIQKDGGMVARILTSTSLAKETLESQLHALKQAFTGQNIQLEKIEITEQLAQSQQKFFEREQQSREQHHDGQESHFYNDDGEEREGDFTISLEEALLFMEA